MIEAYIDGACRGRNPGFTSCAWVLYDPAFPDNELSEMKYLGPERHTNNYAEYMALINLLEYLYSHDIIKVRIHSDSKLVVNQVLHNWECNGDLRRLRDRAYGLFAKGNHILVHVNGHDGNKGNERADELCNVVLDIHKEEYEAKT